nr:hypothetical protein [Tanacetum cinerariifolium]GEY01711.1 hypothetical protein [Tanacetum cinerariifolium]
MVEPLGADEPMVNLMIDEIVELMVEVEKQMVALVVDMKEDLAMLFGDEDFSDDDFEGFANNEEVWEVNEEWLMAPATPPLIPDIPPPSTYEVRGPSTVAVEGYSFTLPTPGFPMPSSMIKDLCTRMGDEIWSGSDGEHPVMDILYWELGWWHTFSKPKEIEEEEKNIQEDINTNPFAPLDPLISLITKEVLKLYSFVELLGLELQLSGTEFVYTKGDDGDVMFIEIIKKNDDSLKEEPKTRGLEVEYFDMFPTQSELAYHKYLMCGPIPLIFLRNPIITEGCPSNLKMPYNVRHVHVEKAYTDLNSSLKIITQMMYNWIMRRKLDPRKIQIEELAISQENFTYATC